MDRFLWNLPFDYNGFLYSDLRLDSVDSPFFLSQSPIDVGEKCKYLLLFLVNSPLPIHFNLFIQTYKKCHRISSTLFFHPRISYCHKLWIFFYRMSVIMAIPAFTYQIPKYVLGFGWITMMSSHCITTYQS